MTLAPSGCFQNNLIRELEHTKKLIEDAHHEKVRGVLSALWGGSSPQH